MGWFNHQLGDHITTKPAVRHNHRCQQTTQAILVPHTFDERNTTPVDRLSQIFTGFYTSQVVSRISSIGSTMFEILLMEEIRLTTWDV